MLTDLTTGKVFYKKLVYLYLEMPKFNKKEDELVTMYDKWLFVLKKPFPLVGASEGVAGASLPKIV